MVPKLPKLDAASIRTVAPLAHAIYLTVFVVICVVVVVALATDIRMDRNSESSPTVAKTAAYQSHGQTLYVEPEVMRLAHWMNIAASASIGCGACVAVIVTAHAKRKAGRPAMKLVEKQGSGDGPSAAV
jgi:hypothetical protein